MFCSEIFVVEFNLASTKYAAAEAPVLVIVTGTTTGVPAANSLRLLFGRPAAVMETLLNLMLPLKGLGDLVTHDRVGEIHDQGPGARHRVEGVSGQ